jgi:hypothetical protein
LEIGLLFGNDGASYRTNLKANTAINAGIEINPIKSCAFRVGSLTRVDTSDWTGIDAVGHALTHVGKDGVGHGSESAHWAWN